MGNFVSGTPSEAVLISGLRGTRVAVGSTSWRWWVIDEVKRLPLELIQVELHSNEAETVHGVKVTVKAVANVKVKARIAAIAEDGKDAKLKVDKEKILVAAQQFLGKTFVYPPDVETIALTLIFSKTVLKKLAIY